MAKLTAPLFSFGASGQLGQALVFFPWKGLKLARTYAVPSNPQSTAQVTQRGYFTDAVDEWTETGAEALTGDDVEAWNRYAGTLGPMSGFNAFVRSWVNELVAGGTQVGAFFGGAVSDATANSFDAAIDVRNGATETVTLHMGVTTTFFPVTSAAAMAAGKRTVAAFDTGYPPGTRVYFYYDLGTPGSNYSRSGIYTALLT